MPLAMHRSVNALLRNFGPVVAIGWLAGAAIGLHELLQESNDSGRRQAHGDPARRVQLQGGYAAEKLTEGPSNTGKLAQSQLVNWINPGI